MSESMAPEEAVKHAAAKWDQVISDKGSVLVLVGSGVDLGVEQRKLGRFLKEIGYNGSYGVRKVYEDGICEMIKG